MTSCLDSGIQVLGISGTQILGIWGIQVLGISVFIELGPLRVELFVGAPII